MKHIKSFVLFFLVGLLITAPACSRKPSPYDFDYREEITPKYCFENYRRFDPNIRYTQCYEFVTTRDKSERILGLSKIEYSAIKDIDDLSFMVCYKTIHWFGVSRWIFVLRRDDCEIEPIMDYTPSKIELCADENIFSSSADSIDVEQDPEAYYLYAERKFSEPILTIDSPEAISEILKIAQRPATMTIEENFREQELYPSTYKRPIYWQSKPLYVKICFEECSGMVWIGKLFADNEGNAYMERCAYIYDPEVETKDACLSISNDFGIGLAKGFIYPLGEHMNAIIAELMTAANE